MSDGNYIGGQSYEPLRRLLSSDRIKKLQGKIKIKDESTPIDWQEHAIPASEVGDSTWQPKFLIAIDGDYNKQAIENGFPGAEIGYVTISTVVILLDKLRKLEKEEFIDPIEFRKTEQQETIDSIYVGCNVVLDGENSAKTSMRRILFEELQNSTVFKNTETLLNTYEALLKIKIDTHGTSRPPKCPHDDCEEDYEYGYGEYKCDHCGGKLYSTDALRLHELMNPSGTNGEMYGQIKDTIKKLQLIHLLRSFEKKPEWFGTLRDIAFFLEGTLAVFSTASWLAKCFQAELARINDLVKESCEQDLIILGVERSGTFVNHFSEIDTKKDGGEDNFPTQSVFLLKDSYIKENIVLNTGSDKTYLQDTGFGRKFFYKTSAGYRVVPSLAFYNDYQANIKNADIAQFPRLADVLTILDKLVSSQYENSVMPLTIAHAEATIPLNIGKRIFEEIAREIRKQQN